jgi:hypothetical protein
VNKGAVVLVSGSITGPGGGGECQVLARRITWSETDKLLPKLAYSDCTVLDAPEHLPDGDYVLHFDGHSAVVTKNRAGWLAFGPAAKDATEPKEKGCD